MIVEWIEEDRREIRHLFDSHTKGRGIIFPALDQGRGNVWVNSLEAPTVARLQLTMINAVAGDSNDPEAEELIRMIEPMQIAFGPDDEWNQIIRKLWGNRLVIQQRTSLSPKSLDLNNLRKLRDQLPTGYVLERMGLETIRRIDKRQAMHIPTFFGSSEDFYKMGVAYCIKYEEKVVSMASTFMPFTDELEIQVDTFDPNHRRRGLATIASAALIIHALENNIVPQWEAANDSSTQLALKLGYTDPEPWEVYYLKPPE
jgi:hypothetical protein